MTDDEFNKLDQNKQIARAEAFYRERIRPKVYPQNKGRMLVIDLDSLDYEIADQDIVATERLWKRRPGCLTLGIRIGYKAAYHFSARWTPEEEC